MGLRVKKLEWVRNDYHECESWVAEIGSHEYEVRRFTGKRWEWNHTYNESHDSHESLHEPCVSLEHGKELAQQHLESQDAVGMYLEEWPIKPVTSGPRIVWCPPEHREAAEKLLSTCEQPEESSSKKHTCPECKSTSETVGHQIIYSFPEKVWAEGFTCATCKAMETERLRDVERKLAQKYNDSVMKVILGDTQ